MYWEWKDRDIIGPVYSKLQRQTWEVTPDDKLQPRKIGNRVSPWFFHGDPTKSERKCDLWHDIYHNDYGIIPKGCLDCWKVALGHFQGLKTVEMFFRVLEYQEGLPKTFSSKCGWETRDFVFGNYSAFWYAPFGCSLDEAREYHRRISNGLKFDVDRVLKPILKRGCTEMELFSRQYFRVGSKGWDLLYKTQNWEKKEKVLDEKISRPWPLIDDSNVVFNFRDWQKMKVVEWAFARGDETYLKLTDGRPLYTVSETYEQSG